MINAIFGFNQKNKKYLYDTIVLIAKSEDNSR